MTNGEAFRLVRRVWINQPSKSQKDHNLHGTCVLALWYPNKDVVDIFFLEGHIISQRIHKTSLSQGWPEHTL